MVAQVKPGYRCESCGASITPTGGQIKRGARFCSRACQKQHTLASCRHATCEVCGTTFPVRDERREARYCSRGCSNTGRRREGMGRGELPVQRECARCGAAFTAYASEVARGKGRFCSRPCADAATGDASSTSVEQTCQECGKVFLCQPNQIESGGGKFCSITCRQLFDSKISHVLWPHMPSANYGPSWGRAKREALERDGGACRECGKTKRELGRNPAVHHIMAFRVFGPERHAEANHIDNLICLCDSCHGTKHPQFQRLRQRWMGDLPDGK